MTDLPARVWLDDPEPYALPVAADVPVTEYLRADLVRDLVAALRDLLASPAELDDERMNYVVVQVGREDLAAARAALARLPEGL